MRRRPPNYHGGTNPRGPTPHMDSPTPTSTEPPAPPRALHGLRRHVAWIVAAKLLLLALLYACFFGPASRPAIDADAAGRRMNIPPG